MDVAWLAMRVHVGRMAGKGGGVDVLTRRGGMWTPPHPPRPKAESPPPLADTRVPLSKAPAHKHPCGPGVT